MFPSYTVSRALNSIDMLFKKLGHLLDAFLPTVIQIIVGMATLCGVLLSNRDRVMLHALNPLKNIRQNSVYRIIQVAINMGIIGTPETISSREKFLV